MVSLLIRNQSKPSSTGRLFQDLSGSSLAMMVRNEVLLADAVAGIKAVASMMSSSATTI